MTDAKKEFWDRLDDVRAGMLGLAGEPTVPMSPNLYEDGEDGVIWFITAQGTHLVTTLTGGPQDGQFVVSDDKEAIYAHIDGVLSLSDDKSVLDEIWSQMAALWFEDGKQDDDLRLIRFAPKRADVWFSEANPVAFFYEVAKAKIADEKPDAGWQTEINF